jgi:biotin carboxyl carrier protein
MSARYLTFVDGREAVVEIVGRDGDRVNAKVELEDGEVQELTFQKVERPGGSYQLLLDDGRVLDGRVMTTDNRTFTVTQGPQRVEVKAIDEMESYLGGGGMDEDESKVTVSMPGRVVKLLVSEGDTVEEGQPVLIVEAMKMENEVKAGRTGVVTRIAVSEGESVEADATLVEIGD